MTNHKPRTLSEDERRQALDPWMKRGHYLPQILRDFHDQKDVFRAIHSSVKVGSHEYCKNIDWVSGQCYVIDIFLWWMAKRGYTLQRSRARVQFRDLYEDVQDQNNRILCEVGSVLDGLSSIARPPGNEEEKP